MSDTAVKILVELDDDGLIHAFDGDVLDLIAGGCGCGGYCTTEGNIGAGLACYCF
jgi:hypothetical protein